MTCHYTDLGSVSNWSWSLLQQIRSTTKIWLVIFSMEFLQIFFVSQTSFLENLVEASQNVGSLYASGKLPTYPFPKLTFCPKWEVSVNVELGEGSVGSFQNVLAVFSGQYWLYDQIFCYWYFRRKLMATGRTLTNGTWMLRMSRFVLLVHERYIPSPSTEQQISSSLPSMR